MKYDFEFKKKVVQEYLNGKGSYGYLAQKYDAGSKEYIHRWVKVYGKFSDKGLLRLGQNNNYCFQFKLSVAVLYLTGEVSYRELSLLQEVKNLF